MARTRQLNLRLPEESMDVLDAAAFLERRSAQDLVAVAVRKVVEELGRDPDVQRVVETRRTRRPHGLDPK